MGVLVALLSNFAYIIVIVAGYMLIGSMTGLTVYLIICVAVTALVAACLRVWLKRRGVEILEVIS